MEEPASPSFHQQQLLNQNNLLDYLYSLNIGDNKEALFISDLKELTILQIELLQYGITIVSNSNTYNQSLLLYNSLYISQQRLVQLPCLNTLLSEDVLPIYPELTNAQYRWTDAVGELVAIKDGIVTYQINLLFNTHTAKFACQVACHDLRHRLYDYRNIIARKQCDEIMAVRATTSHNTPLATHQVHIMGDNLVATFYKNGIYPSTSKNSSAKPPDGIPVPVMPNSTVKHKQDSDAALNKRKLQSTTNNEKKRKLSETLNNTIVTQVPKRARFFCPENTSATINHASAWLDSINIWCDEQMILYNQLKTYLRGTKYKTFRREIHAQIQLLKECKNKSVGNIRLGLISSLRQKNTDPAIIMIKKNGRTLTYMLTDAHGESQTETIENSNSIRLPNSAIEIIESQQTWLPKILVDALTKGYNIHHCSNEVRRNISLSIIQYEKLYNKHCGNHRLSNIPHLPPSLVVPDILQHSTKQPGSKPSAFRPP